MIAVFILKHEKVKYIKKENFLNGFCNAICKINIIKREINKNKNIYLERQMYNNKIVIFLKKYKMLYSINNSNNIK